MIEIQILFMYIKENFQEIKPLTSNYPHKNIQENVCVVAALHPY